MHIGSIVLFCYLLCHIAEEDGGVFEYKLGNPLGKFSRVFLCFTVGYLCQRTCLGTPFE